MPMDMSSSRPAALSRGPTEKPRSLAVKVFAARPDTSTRARMPGRVLPPRMRLKPWWTRMRLLRSSGTTSATVPRATRSSQSARLGSPIPRRSK